MELNSWPGLIAVILAVICFYGTTYVVIALSLGWRFGYWVAASCFGALMVLLSIFWVINVETEQAKGPQGSLPKWLPIAADTEVSQASFGGETLSTPAQYPQSPWTPAEEGDDRVDALSSTVTTCVQASVTALEKMPEFEREACEQAQTFWPEKTEIPVLEGAAVAVQPNVKNVRFTEEKGVLAQMEVSAVTKDPRVSKDPAGKALGETFRLVAILDKGSVGLPSLMSLVIFAIFEAFHLWGLNRAEKRKLSPVSI